MSVGRYEHLVFVYGTLKRNQPNHAYMMDPANGRAEFVCTARTEDRYPVVIASQFNIPFLLNKAGTGHQINGEVYSLDSKMLAFLDDFEGHPAYYTRRETPTLRTDDNSSVPLQLRPWIYTLNRYKPEMLALPMLATYDSRGDHGLPYVERLERQGAENAHCGHTEMGEATTCLEDLEELVDFMKAGQAGEEDSDGASPQSEHNKEKK
ncbi:hypothetical protein TYRP_012788 [Tyrophagus putrescentiae]|nr:hypothetical protein TYRP_012788 [Tyrophagus putrescentiae]